uniref:DBB domain-containing protein n=1 Tax=Timema genevievae TaxID=629358 RepID=A0A7R9JSE8_TIMGE|nr:unnamed protein product [Timema genevievae]
MSQVLWAYSHQQISVRIGVFTHHLSRGGRDADMEDILIVSSRDSQAAALWVNYLTTCFNQISKQRNRPPFNLEEKMVRVKLQIVIVCPQFLEQVYQHPAPALGKLLQPDRVLAMLLGVEEDNVTEQHRAALITYQQWCRLPVKDQDASFVGDFLEVAMGILAKVLRQSTAHTEKAMFSLLPKKVKEGQNKVIVLLNDPISKEDKIKVSVDKNGERIDVTNVKRRNPFTLHFQMPACCLEVSMLVNVYVEKNGEPLGCRQVKCESRMRELDQMLRSWDNPLEFMCQVLGALLVHSVTGKIEHLSQYSSVSLLPGNKEHLDNFLVSALQRNLPPHFNLLHTPTGPEEYPTLLHFAARFGLEKLSWQLLECPGGEQACEIRNVCELTPAEMAEGAGHTKLANALRGYMQMTELTSMYSYLKIMSEGNNKVAGGGVKKSREQLSQGAQDQLLEIINDFKNNVFTISEVEKLVDSWKNRNDVQQSFKDKQEQLSQMRQEYERLQTQMKEQMKRPTPFDRIRGFFKGKPKDVKETAGDSSSGSPADGSKVAASADNVPLCMRPVSSLSLHSTCSECTSHLSFLYYPTTVDKDVRTRTQGLSALERVTYMSDITALYQLMCFVSLRVPLIRSFIQSELSEELGV